MSDASNSAAPRRPRTAVVTGGSSGIGRTTALALARAGADVWIHCRSQLDRAEAVAEEIRRLGRKASVSAGDLADPQACRDLCHRAWGWRPGGVDVWVNNAGVDVLTGEAADADFEQKLRDLWEVDVLGTIRLSRDIGERMKTSSQGAGQRQPGGLRTIINIGWDQAEHGMEGDSGEMFAAVKGAVMAFTRSLAKSLAPQVRVNCVAPGWIRTSWGQQASAAWQQRAVAESLLQRWGEPEDVADAVVFLASPQARFLTGATLPVNGGFRHGSPTDRADGQ